MNFYDKDKSLAFLFVVCCLGPLGVNDSLDVLDLQSGDEGASDW